MPQREGAQLVPMVRIKNDGVDLANLPPSFDGEVSSHFV